MKKLRIQPSFASLTEDELEQLACMTQRETFAVVLERARKPRSEGGFGLTLRSESPLERLLDKKNKLDLINAQITSGQKLTLAQLDTFTAGEKRAPEEVHDAIMSATYILVTEHDNTPHQLLALQRLADFPARAEYREQSAQIRAERLEITRAREARAQAKAQREAEMHTHKIQMDHIRVFLKSNNRGGTSFSGGTSSKSPTSISRDAITDHAAASADQNAPIENSENSTSLSSVPPSSVPSVSRLQSFLSPEVIANNRLYDQKIDAGEIRVIYAPGKHYEIEYCNPADKPALERMHKSPPLHFFQDPTRTTFLPPLRSFGKNPYIPPATAPTSVTTQTPVSPEATHSTAAAPTKTLNAQLSQE